VPLQGTRELPSNRVLALSRVLPPAWLWAYLHAASRLSTDAATGRWLISLRVTFPFSFTAHAASHAAAPPAGSAHSAAHVSSSVRPQFAAMPGICAAPTTATV
jgi:hypothetical protein